MDLRQEIETNLGNQEAQILEEMIAQFKKTNTEDTSDFHTFVPTQGFVIKTKMISSTEYPKDTKVFVNLCFSTEIPRPPLVPKEEIIKAIQNDDASKYKVPLSLSKPRSDVDKSRFH
jgi:hypothetical protein